MRQFKRSKNENKKQELSESFFGHNVVEIFSWNFSSIRGSPLKHFFQLAVIHGLAQFLGDSLDIVDIDEASSVVIKEIKDFINSVLRIK